MEVSVTDINQILNQARAFFTNGAESVEDFFDKTADDVRAFLNNEHTKEEIANAKHAISVAADDAGEALAEAETIIAAHPVRSTMTKLVHSVTRIRDAVIAEIADAKADVRKVADLVHAVWNKVVAGEEEVQEVASLVRQHNLANTLHGFAEGSATPLVTTPHADIVVEGYPQAAHEAQEVHEHDEV